MPKVTVLTPTYNGERYIEETINSIRTQSFTDWEYIIVDDGSTDKTPEILERFLTLDRRIRVIHQENSGSPYIAANTGLKIATGEFIVCTDHDDISLPNRIQTQLEFLENHKNIDACTTYVRSIVDGKIYMRGWSPTPVSSCVLKWALCLQCMLGHSSLCMKHSLFNSLGGYREETKTNEDYRLFCTLARMDKLAVIPEFCVHYRYHKKSITKSRRDECFHNDVIVIGEHLSEISSIAWSDDEIYSLNNGWLLASINKSLSSLKKWDELWLKDEKLNPDQFMELRDISSIRRKKLLQYRRKLHPVSFLLNVKSYLEPEP